MTVLRWGRAMLYPSVHLGLYERWSMNQFDGELAALQSRRQMEQLNTSPIVEGLNNLAEISSEFGIPGAGLFAKALKSGRTPIEKVVEQVESGAYSEIVRIRQHLESQDGQLREFSERLQKQEAQSAYQSAVLHGLRTSDPQKQSRLGILTINCIYVGDLKSENLDEMMRAVVELTGNDLQVLGRLYRSQNGILNNRTQWALSHEWQDQVHAAWQREFSSSERDHLDLRGSLMRLQSVGLIASVETKARDGSIANQPFGMLLEGAKFYERLQEIGNDN